MDHSSACKVQRPEGASPATAPCPVGKRVVDQCCPEQSEDDECTQFDTLRNAGGQYRQRQAGKYQLEDHEQQVRNTVSVHSDAIQGNDIKLGPMLREELGLAIERPAEKQGVTFETGLVERILDDVGEEPGNLPLLEFALTTLWEQQQDRRLSHTGYETIDRVEGALTRHADEVYTRLSQAEQAAIIGKAIGRDVRFEEITPEAAREGMLAEGWPADVAEGALAAWSRMVEQPEPVLPTVQEITGQPARPFRQWAADHADAFR